MLCSSLLQQRIGTNLLLLEENDGDLVLGTITEVKKTTAIEDKGSGYSRWFHFSFYSFLDCNKKNGFIVIYY